jgi:hypothetical protein
MGPDETTDPDHELVGDEKMYTGEPVDTDEGVRRPQQMPVARTESKAAANFPIRTRRRAPVQWGRTSDDQRPGRHDRGIAMKRWEVVKKNDRWVTRTKSGKVKLRAKTKAAALRRTARLAASDRQAVSVRIHKANGKIGEERTYPRSKDPRRSKG